MGAKETIVVKPAPTNQVPLREAQGQNLFHSLNISRLDPTFLFTTR